MNELAAAPADVVDVPALPAASVLAPDRHPAAVHLASLADGPGRVSMRSTLAHAAAMLVTALDACPWQELRFARVAAALGPPWCCPAGGTGRPPAPPVRVPSREFLRAPARRRSGERRATDEQCVPGPVAGVIPWTRRFRQPPRTAG